jgi:hypothetical protein
LYGKGFERLRIKGESRLDTVQDFMIDVIHDNLGINWKNLNLGRLCKKVPEARRANPEE